MPAVSTTKQPPSGVDPAAMLEWDPTDPGWPSGPGWGGEGWPCLFGEWCLPDPMPPIVGGIIEIFGGGGGGGGLTGAVGSVLNGGGVVPAIVSTFPGGDTIQLTRSRHRGEQVAPAASARPTTS